MPVCNGFRAALFSGANRLEEYYDARHYRTPVISNRVSTVSKVVEGSAKQQFQLKFQKLRPDSSGDTTAFGLLVLVDGFFIKFFYIEKTELHRIDDLQTLSNADVGYHVRRGSASEHLKFGNNKGTYS